MSASSMLLPSVGAQLGAIVLGTSVAILCSAYLMPKALPLFVELCRGEQRGRFWNHFLGITLVLSVPLGGLLALVVRTRGQDSALVVDSAEAIATSGEMIRLGLSFGASVLVLMTACLWLFTLKSGAESAANSDEPR